MRPFALLLLYALASPLAAKPGFTAGPLEEIDDAVRQAVTDARPPLTSACVLAVPFWR